MWQLRDERESSRLHNGSEDLSRGAFIVLGTHLCNFFMETTVTWISHVLCSPRSTASSTEVKDERDRETSPPLFREESTRAETQTPLLICYHGALNGRSLPRLCNEKPPEDLLLMVAKEEIHPRVKYLPDHCIFKICGLVSKAENV